MPDATTPATSVPAAPVPAAPVPAAPVPGAPAMASSTTASTVAANPAVIEPVKEPSPYTTMLPLLLIFVVFYFLLIRPQQKKLKDHTAMMKALKRGDKVVTGGGILGTVIKIENDDTVSIEVAPDVRLRVMKDSVASVIGGDDAKAPTAKIKTCLSRRMIIDTKCYPEFVSGFTLNIN